MKNLLLIGDSIRMGYDKSVKKTLEGRANVIFPAENCRFARHTMVMLRDMKDMLTGKFIEENGHPDIVVLDPPRAGIHPDVAQVILNAAPDRMVYVSCNPASQARDLEILCKDYVITAVRPVDMFPHTHHVENVVALKRK